MKITKLCTCESIIGYKTIKKVSMIVLLNCDFLYFVYLAIIIAIIILCVHILCIIVSMLQKVAFEITIQCF